MMTAYKRRPSACDAEDNSGAPELALMQAILQDAILCLCGHTGGKAERERLAAEALRWVKSTVRTWPFSFENICDVLGLDAGYVRAKLLQQARPAPTKRACETARRRGDEDEPMMRRIRMLRLRGNSTTRVLCSRRSHHRRS